jgi:hypothetical protein
MRKHIATVLAASMASTAWGDVSDRFSSLEIGNFISLGLCGAGAAYGVANASGNKELDPTWTTLGFMGLGCGLSLLVNMAFTPDKEKARLDEIQNVMKSRDDLQRQLDQMKTQERVGTLSKSGPWSPLDALSMLPALPKDDSVSTLDLSLCKERTYRLFLTQDALVSKLQMMRAENLPEIAWSPQLAVTWVFRVSPEGCFRPNLKSGRFLSVYGGDLDVLFRDAAARARSMHESTPGVSK